MTCESCEVDFKDLIRLVGLDEDKSLEVFSNHGIIPTSVICPKCNMEKNKRREVQGMDKDFFYDFIAGWIGGCAGLIAGHPLDTVKVRQQVMGKMTIVKCLVNTFKFEGSRGFYKGLGFPLLTTGTLNSLFFGVYGNTIRYMSAGREKPTYNDVFWAGCAGGVVQLLVACPVDLVKIKMQVQTGDDTKSWGHVEKKCIYKGPTACLIDLYRKGGIPNCYHGLNSMVLRDVPSFGVYMVIYEAFIRAVSGSEENASALSLIFCGGMAGALSWVTIVPLDVVKSRIQADDPQNPKYKGMWDCAVKSYQKEGLSVFTRGFVMVTVRALPTNGAIFFGYVTSLNLLRGSYNKSTEQAL